MRNPESRLICPNCDASLAVEDRYCRQCGQQKLTVDSRKFVTLVKSSLKEATSLNGRVLPTVLALLFRPGKLAAAYIAGQRRRYLKPINVFLLANLLFFLSPPQSDFSLVLTDQYTSQPYSGWIRPAIDTAIADSNSTFGAFAADYNRRAVDIGRLLIIVHVPLLALISFLVAFDRRYWYADHVVSVLHFFAFFMLVPIALDRLAALLPTGIADMVWLGAAVLPVLYIPVMFHNAFHLPWYRTALATLVFLPALLGTHILYRLLQFWIVFAMMQPG